MNKNRIMKNTALLIGFLCISAYALTSKLEQEQHEVLVRNVQVLDESNND